MSATATDLVAGFDTYTTVDDLDTADSEIVTTTQPDGPCVSWASTFPTTTYSVTTDQ